MFDKRDKYIMALIVCIMLYLIYRGKNPHVENGEFYDIIAVNIIIFLACGIYFLRRGFYMTISRLSEFAYCEPLEYKWYYDEKSGEAAKCHVRVVGYDEPWYKLDEYLAFNFIKKDNEGIFDFAKKNSTVGSLLSTMKDNIHGNKRYLDFRMSYDIQKVGYYVMSFVLAFFELAYFLAKTTLM